MAGSFPDVFNDTGRTGDLLMKLELMNELFQYISKKLLNFHTAGRS
jgi:hypothetical protein